MVYFRDISQDSVGHIFLIGLIGLFCIQKEGGGKVIHHRTNELCATPDYNTLQLHTNTTADMLGAQQPVGLWPPWFGDYRNQSAGNEVNAPFKAASTAPGSV